MKKSIFTQVGNWISTTPLRSLDQAYQAARQIQSIEERHFQGRPIRSLSEHGKHENRYFQGLLQKQLKLIEIRLAEFRMSSLVSTVTESNYAGQNQVLDKLKFIDEVTIRYAKEKPFREELSNQMRSSNEYLKTQKLAESLRDPVPDAHRLTGDTLEEEKNKKNKFDKKLSTSAAQRYGVIPRSILTTFKRLRRELDPNFADQVIDDFRISRTKTLVSLRFLSFLIVLPFLTQLVSKALIFSPVVDHLSHAGSNKITLNYQLQQEALEELHIFKEQLEFDHFVLETEVSESEKEHLLQEKAIEIREKYNHLGLEGIKNILADMTSFLMFVLILVLGRDKIPVLKAFLDQLVYGLSDSAKAFIIILFTDIFVGYHSPHGWEVLLEALARHLGLPESREFIFAFVATVPVILDTLFKYWVFRYLNSLSPSAVSTYKTMNE
jgi:hypothetical protein